MIGGVIICTRIASKALESIECTYRIQMVLGPYQRYVIEVLELGKVVVCWSLRRRWLKVISRDFPVDLEYCAFHYVIVHIDIWLNSSLSYADKVNSKTNKRVVCQVRVFIRGVSKINRVDLWSDWFPGIQSLCFAGGQTLGWGVIQWKYGTKIWVLLNSKGCSSFLDIDGERCYRWSWLRSFRLKSYGCSLSQIYLKNW